MKEQFRSSITSFVRLSKAWNIKPILMTQGNRIDPDFEYFLKWAERHQRGKMTPEEFSTLYSAMNDITRDVASKENITLIDLDALIPKSNKYIYDTIHLNETGSILMGEIVSAALLDLIKTNK